MDAKQTGETKWFIRDNEQFRPLSHTLSLALDNKRRDAQEKSRNNDHRDDDWTFHKFYNVPDEDGGSLKYDTLDMMALSMDEGGLARRIPGARRYSDTICQELGRFNSVIEKQGFIDEVRRTESWCFCDDTC